MQKLTRWALVLLAMAVVLWVRTQPLSVPVTDDWADQLVRRQIGVRIAQENQKRGRPSSFAQVEREVQAWIDGNAARFDAERAAVSEGLKSRLRYVGPDGQARVLLGDIDSYQWLRAARNYLHHGTTCDAVVDGECRDTFADAPVGAHMIYNRSLHIAAIVGLHELITYFRPGYPLPASSFWVPVIIGVLGALPAFGIGWRLGGNVAGLWAALLVSLDSSLLARSIGSDNDVWNVVLPLFMFWAMIEALAASDWRRRVGYTVLAAGFTGLHAATWSGWPFGYVILLAGLIAMLAFQALRVMPRRQRGGAPSANPLCATATVLVVFYVAAGVFTTLAGSRGGYLDLPLRLVGVRLGGSALAPTADVGLWPSALATVAELVSPGLAKMAESKGGPLSFLGALVGLLSLLLPAAWWRRRPRWRDAYGAVLVGGTVLYVAVLFVGEVSRAAVLCLAAAPLAVASMLRLFDPEADDVPPAAFLIALWFLGAMYAGYGVVRFLLLLGPPFGLALAGGIGRLQQAVALRGRRPQVARAIVLTLALPLLLPPLWNGYGTARAYVPKMNDAWWSVLNKIRDQSAPDAIVDTMWDYGYWVKYVAERRVSCDGGTLSTHVHHWLGRALVTPSERESIGMLRMLNCGSDATPQPEGRQGAYGKIVAKLGDPIAAVALVTQLAGLDESSARAALAARGFTAEEQADVLRSTHCRPPESFLLLTTEQLTTATTWMQFGRWDFRRAYIAEAARSQPQAELLPQLVARFGYSRERAAALYDQARGLRSQREREDFAASRTWYLTPQWIACHDQSDGKMLCPLGMRDRQTGALLDSFVYDPEAPEQSRLRVRRSQAGVLAAQATDETPAALLLADAAGERGVTLGPTTLAQFGALVDIPNRRVLVGSPFLLRSTFVQLMYLDGRYAHRYEKFDERIAYNGERVEVWRVKWDGDG